MQPPVGVSKMCTRLAHSILQSSAYNKCMCIKSVSGVTRLLSKVCTLWDIHWMCFSKLKWKSDNFEGDLLVED